MGSLLAQCYDRRDERAMVEAVELLS